MEEVPEATISADQRTARNIDQIVRLEKAQERELSALHRMSHSIGSFVGTIYFIIVQCLLIGIWIACNLAIFGPGSVFDPYPFALLSTFLSLETVLLTSFILIRQNVMDRRSERRNHLDLQINLLAEEEATEALRLLRLLVEYFNMQETGVTPTSPAQRTQVETIARDLKSREGD